MPICVYKCSYPPPNTPILCFISQKETKNIQGVRGRWFRVSLEGLRIRYFATICTVFFVCASLEGLRIRYFAI